MSWRSWDVARWAQKLGPVVSRHGQPHGRWRNERLWHPMTSSLSVVNVGSYKSAVKLYIRLRSMLIHSVLGTNTGKLSGNSWPSVQENSKQNLEDWRMVEGHLGTQTCKEMNTTTNKQRSWRHENFTQIRAWVPQNWYEFDATSSMSSLAWIKTDWNSTMNISTYFSASWLVVRYPIPKISASPLEVLIPWYGFHSEHIFKTSSWSFKNVCPADWRCSWSRLGTLQPFSRHGPVCLVLVLSKFITDSSARINLQDGSDGSTLTIQLCAIELRLLLEQKPTKTHNESIAHQQRPPVASLCRKNMSCVRTFTSSI